MPARRPTTGLAGLLDDADPLTLDVGLTEVFEEDAFRNAPDDDGDGDEFAEMRSSSFRDWAMLVPTPKRPLDLERFAFQVELYGAEWEYAPDGAIKKAAQLGVSENLLRWALRWVDRGRTGLYVLPKAKHAVEFSTMRLAPVIAASAYLRARTKEREKASDTQRLKSIGLGFFAMRGSQSKDELDSVDADVLVLDEYDRQVQAHIADAEQRVTGPLSEGLIRRCSTPTVPGFGIDPVFQDGDRRRWTVRCGGLSRRGKRGAGCGEWIPMMGTETLDRNVFQDDGGRYFLGCHHCGRELDVTQGQYVAEVLDGAPYPSYHLPKFVVPGINLAKIVENSTASKPLDIKTHKNKDLGEGWQPEEAGLSQRAIDAAERPFYMNCEGYRGAALVTMGVDIATSRALNVRISKHLNEDEKVMLWSGLVDDGIAPWGRTKLTAYEILAECMERYGVHTAVLDNEPGGRLTRAFCEKFRGRAWRCVYVTQAEVIKADKEQLQVKVRRLEAIDSTLDLIRRQKNLLASDRPGPTKPNGKDGWDDQLKNVVLNVEVDDESGKLVQEWVHTGPADYAHAEVYDVVATHMAYVGIYEGAAAQTAGTIAPTRDPIQEVGDWQRAAGAEFEAIPDDGDGDEPMGGW